MYTVVEISRIHVVSNSYSRLANEQLTLQPLVQMNE